MSKKINTIKHDSSRPTHPPPTIHLTDVVNQPHAPAVASLRHRIQELQNKVNQLQTKIKSKRKRIRRKSCDVEKKHTCQFCNRSYGSMVSLNLHLRIKHKREKVETKMKDEDSAKCSEEGVEAKQKKEFK